MPQSMQRQWPTPPNADLQSLYLWDLEIAKLLRTGDIFTAGSDVSSGLVTATGSTTARSLADRFADVVNVRDYGAIGDGVADDRGAIIAGDISAFIMGKALFFPSGTYNISATLTPSTGGRWLGEDYQTTAIRITSATADLLSITNSFVTIEEIQFSASVARSAGSFVNINATNFSLRSFIMAAAFVGITLGTSCSIVRISDGVINDTVASTGNSIVLNGGLVAYFSRIIATNASGAKPFSHVQVNNGGDYNFADCGFILATHNMYIAPGAGQTVASLRCNNVYFDQADSNNLTIVPSSTGAVFRSDFVQCWFTQAGSGSGVLATPSGGSSFISGLDFIGCHVFGNSVAGYAIAGANAINIGIIGGEIAQNATGIALDTATTSIRISGNKIGATAGYTANTVGLSLSATAIDYVTCIANDFVGSTTPITDASTGTHNIIHSNANVDDWKSFATTIAASTGTITTKTGTMKYMRVNRAVFIELQITITTNGTGAGAVTATLPFAAASPAVLAGREAALAGKMLQGSVNSGSSTLAVANYDNTYPGANGSVLWLSGVVQI